MEKFFRIFRRITVPPVFAAAFLITAYILRMNYFGGVWHLFGALFFLSVLPTLAYPLQAYIPKYKYRGREGQRSLAMIFSFAGYLLGAVTAFAFSAPTELKIIYLEYLLCGIGMLLFNKVFKIKASGHACGIVGPVLLLLYFGLYILAAVGLVLILPVYISSIRTGQHTLPQLICGSAIPFAVLLMIVVFKSLLLN